LPLVSSKAATFGAKIGFATQKIQRQRRAGNLLRRLVPVMFEMLARCERFALRLFGRC
jgi:hypothetical protein